MRAWIIFFHFSKVFNNFKHEYLRSRAYICLSLSSPSSSSWYLSIKSWTFEILVLTYWIPASKNFEFQCLFLDAIVIHFTVWQKTVKHAWRSTHHLVGSPPFRKTCRQENFAYQLLPISLMTLFNVFEQHVVKWCCHADYKTSTSFFVSSKLQNSTVYQLFYDRHRFKCMTKGKLSKLHFLSPTMMS